MSIKHRLNSLEKRAKPAEPVVYKVYMPGIDGTEEEIEAKLRDAEARGETVFRVRFPSPRDE